jgi:hypothetical protein
VRLFGASRGEEKIYQSILYSLEGLENRAHTLRIVVAGSKNPRSNNAYVSIDAFAVLGESVPQGDVRMNLINAWKDPELDWGNYVKPPIIIGPSYTDTVCMRLSELE